MPTAHGTFVVTLTPQPPGEHPDDAAIGRMIIDKQFSGDLTGTSRGQMLAARTAVEGSAGYVALERVHVTLHGRTGSFVLQHSGTMDRSAQHLVISVVPDSADGALAGLAGTMTLAFADGGHQYTLEYTLPAAE